MRRAFARPNNEHLIAMHWEVPQGARRNGVPEEIAGKIFGKINGHYMFPESHAPKGTCMSHLLSTAPKVSPPTESPRPAIVKTRSRPKPTPNHLWRNPTDTIIEQVH